MSLPTHRTQFIIILVELFFVLKLYDLWEEGTGLDTGLFFVLAFILFWLLNWIVGKLFLGPDPQETLMFKVLPRMTFSNDWFGILIAISIIFGYGIARLIGSAAVAYLIIFLIAGYAYHLIKQKKNILKHSYGLVVLGLVFGIAFGNRYTSKTVIVVIFIVAMLFMYLSAELDYT
ncbi:MAG: hypothetical protein GXP63_05800 [DPANN group archaeon]|nr:hypothetical protein [DPANN group archaeon]